MPYKRRIKFLEESYWIALDRANSTTDNLEKTRYKDLANKLLSELTKFRQEQTEQESFLEYDDDDDYR